MSYGELNRRADQLAHYLRGLGVKTGCAGGHLRGAGLRWWWSAGSVERLGGAYGRWIRQVRIRWSGSASCSRDMRPGGAATPKPSRFLVPELCTVPVLGSEQRGRWKSILDSNPIPITLGLTPTICYGHLDFGF